MEELHFFIGAIVMLMVVVAVRLRSKYDAYVYHVQKGYTWSDRREAKYCGKINGQLFPIFLVTNRWTKAGLTIGNGAKKPWVATFDEIIDKPYGNGLRGATVTYKDGTVISTSLAEGMSDKEILEYFREGKTFNVGLGPDDNVQSIVKCEIIK